MQEKWVWPWVEKMPLEEEMAPGLQYSGQGNPDEERDLVVRIVPKSWSSDLATKQQQMSIKVLLQVKMSMWVSKVAKKGYLANFK